MQYGSINTEKTEGELFSTAQVVTTKQRFQYRLIFLDIDLAAAYNLVYIKDFPSVKFAKWYGM